MERASAAAHRGHDPRRGTGGSRRPVIERPDTGEVGTVPTRRRRGDAKRDDILAAAAKLFFAGGVEATTIEDIAAEASVSKVTIYAHFGDKLSLFELCVRRAVSGMEAELAPSTSSTDPIAHRLLALGVPLLTFFTSEPLVRFDRVLALEASRHPELARRFFEAGPYHVRDRLADMLSAADQRGEIFVDDPLQGAEDMIGLWLGLLHKELSMGRVAPPGAEAIERRVRHGVEVFMRAYERRSDDGIDRAGTSSVIMG